MYGYFACPSARRHLRAGIPNNNTMFLLYCNSLVGGGSFKGQQQIFLYPILTNFAPHESEIFKKVTKHVYPRLSLFLKLFLSSQKNAADTRKSVSPYYCILKDLCASLRKLLIFHSDVILFFCQNASNKACLVFADFLEFECLIIIGLALILQFSFCHER